MTIIVLAIVIGFLLAERAYSEVQVRKTVQHMSDLIIAKDGMEAATMEQVRSTVQRTKRKRARLPRQVGTS